MAKGVARRDFQLIPPFGVLPAIQIHLILPFGLLPEPRNQSVLAFG